MLDPYKDRYGEIVAAIMYLPPMLGELFWSSAILSALGNFLTLNLESHIPIVSLYYNRTSRLRN